jgi:hypothetical protein
LNHRPLLSQAFEGREEKIDGDCLHSKGLISTPWKLGTKNEIWSMAENLKQRLQRAFVYEVTWTGYSGFTATVNTAVHRSFQRTRFGNPYENVVGLGESRGGTDLNSGGRAFKPRTTKRASVRPKLKRDPSGSADLTRTLAPLGKASWIPARRSSQTIRVNGSFSFACKSCGT